MLSADYCGYAGMSSGVYLEPELLDSAAFKGLGKWEWKVYLRFLQKRIISKPKTTKNRSAEKIVVNNGEIIFTYGEAEKMGIPRREFRDSLDGLIKLGLIDINKLGSGGWQRDATTYFISERWKRWGRSDYQQTLNPRQRNTKQGQGWAIVNLRRKQKSVTKLTPKDAVSSGKNATPSVVKDPFQMADMSLEEIERNALCC
jgi:hypothetical protein